MAGPISFGYQVLGFGGGKKPAAAASTTKFTVRIAEFTDDGECTCSLTSTYEIWENDTNNSSYPGGGLTLAVNDWIAGVDSSSEYKCAQVTGINSTGSAVGNTDTKYDDCDACNSDQGICMGDGGDGPGGP